VSGPGVTCASGAEVLASLREHEARFARDGDRRAIFCSAYVEMTAAVLAHQHGGFFVDDAWMDRLTVAFGHRYFLAVTMWDDGRAAELPAAWRHAFEAPRELPVLNHLLLGMTAHILRDLPFALAEVLPRQAREPCRRDFLRLIRVVHKAIDPIQDRVATRYAPGLLLLDRLFLRADEWGTLASVWLHRRLSFHEALQLQDAADPEACRRRIERRSAVIAAALLRLPPTRCARLALARIEQEDPRAWPVLGSLLDALFVRLA
jgi:hypothetical protein